MTFLALHIELVADAGGDRILVEIDGLGVSAGKADGVSAPRQLGEIAGLHRDEMALRNAGFRRELLERQAFRFARGSQLRADAAPRFNDVAVIVHSRSH